MHILSAQAGWLSQLEDTINTVFEPVNKWANNIIMFEISLGPVTFPFVVLWLVVAATVISFYFGFPQFRHLKVSLDVVRGKFSSKSDPGEVPHFQALTSALSGTVGLGNIAGVGAAVALGGAGATFWMIIAGLLGMATKFAECTVGVKYREVHEDGTVTGGPFKYLPVAFKKFGKIPSKVLTGLFAFAILMFGVAGGNMFQSNQTFAQARQVAGGDDGILGSDAAAFLFGLGLAILVALVILGGMKSIGRVTSRLVPAMGIVYVVACLTVIIVNITEVPGAIQEIVGGAFSPEGVGGGIVGVMIVGFQRAAFSNEAGLGSAPIAHSTVKTRRPVSEGFNALLEPLVDTVIVCTMTALTIIIANPASFTEGRAQVEAGGPAPDGVILTSDAFETGIGWFPIVLAIAVALFAFSTLVTWAYYGEKAWQHLFGRTKGSDTTYKIIFCTFTVIGAVLTFGEVLGFADAFLFMCAFINLLGLYMLLPVIKKEMREYLADRKSGKLHELGAETDSDLAEIRRENET